MRVAGGPGYRKFTTLGMGIQTIPTLFHYQKIRYVSMEISLPKHSPGFKSTYCYLSWKSCAGSYIMYVIPSLKNYWTSLKIISFSILSMLPLHHGTFCFCRGSCFQRYWWILTRLRSFIFWKGWKIFRQDIPFPIWEMFDIFRSSWCLKWTLDLWQKRAKPCGILVC